MGAIDRCAEVGASAAMVAARQRRIAEILGVGDGEGFGRT
jgi:hypothetical protein